MRKKATRLIRVKVSRRRWLRGGDGQYSALRRSSDNKQCCLGFVCRAMGLKVQEILDRAMPNSLDNLDKVLTERFPGKVQKMCVGPGIKAASINDNPGMSESQRERKLLAVGKTFGVQFEFVP